MPVSPSDTPPRAPKADGRIHEDRACRALSTVSGLGKAVTDISYSEVRWYTPASLAPKRQRQDGGQSALHSETCLKTTAKVLTIILFFSKFVYFMYIGILPACTSV